MVGHALPESKDPATVTKGEIALKAAKQAAAYTRTLLEHPNVLNDMLSRPSEFPEAAIATMPLTKEEIDELTASPNQAVIRNLMAEGDPATGMVPIRRGDGTFTHSTRLEYTALWGSEYSWKGMKDTKKVLDKLNKSVEPMIAKLVLDLHARQDAEKRETYAASIGAKFYIASLMVGMIDPKLGRSIDVVGRATEDFVKMTFKLEKWASLESADKWILRANLIGIGLTLFQAMQESSEKQALSKQLENIQKMIEALGKKIDFLTDTTIIGFSQVLEALQVQGMDIARILTNQRDQAIFKMLMDERRDYQVFDLNVANLQKKTSTCLNRNRDTGAPFSVNDLQICLDEIRDFAVQATRKDVDFPELSSESNFQKLTALEVTESQAASDYLAQMSLGRNPYQLASVIGSAADLNPLRLLLKRFIFESPIQPAAPMKRVKRVATPTYLDQLVPNVKLWLESADGYTRVAAQNMKHIKPGFIDNTVKQVRPAGQAVADFYSKMANDLELQEKLWESLRIAYLNLAQDIEYWNKISDIDVARFWQSQHPTWNNQIEGRFNVPEGYWSVLPRSVKLGAYYLPRAALDIQVGSWTADVIPRVDFYNLTTKLSGEFGTVTDYRYRQATLRRCDSSVAVTLWNIGEYCVDSTMFGRPSRTIKYGTPMSKAFATAANTDTLTDVTGLNSHLRKFLYSQLGVALRAADPATGQISSVPVPANFKADYELLKARMIDIWNQYKILVRYYQTIGHFSGLSNSCVDRIKNASPEALLKRLLEPEVTDQVAAYVPGNRSDFPTTARQVVEAMVNEVNALQDVTDAPRGQNHPCAISGVQARPIMEQLRTLDTLMDVVGRNPVADCRSQLGWLGFAGGLLCR